LEYALYKLWESWGIKPSVVMGHSLGEYVAATVAGVFSLEDGLKLIAHRGRLMQQLPTGGEMLSIMASYEQVNQLIAPYSDKVAIAGINGPQSMVISGESEAIAKVKEILDSLEIKTKQLPVSHAFHSHLMEPMLAEFAQLASEITYNQPNIPLISNVTGNRADESIATASYWVNHVRQPVKFAQSMQTLHQEGCQIFLEIGAKPILLGMGRQCLPEGTGVWLPSLRPPLEDTQQILQSLAELYVRGVKVDWLGFDRDYPRNKVVLPTYPFQRQRYWIETSQKYSNQLDQQIYPLLGSKFELANNSQIIYQQNINLTNYPWIGDHRVYDTAVVPGVSYIAMLFAAVGTPAVIEEVHFIQPLILENSDVNRETQLLIHAGDNDQNKQKVQVFSRDAASKDQWQKHCEMTLLNTEPSLEALKVDIKALTEQLKPIEINLLKDIYAKVSFTYGPMLEAVTQAWIGEEISLLEIQVPQALESQLTEEPIHPVLLDACTRLFPGSLDAFVDEKGVFWAPWKVEGITLTRSAPQHFYAYINQPKVNEKLQVRTIDIHLLDEMGQVFGRIDGFTVRRAPREVFLKNLQVDIDDWLYRINWQPQSTATSNKSIDLTKPGSWLLFSPATGIGKHLVEFLEQKGQHCILVSPGENYQQLKSQHYQINPINGSEFERLLQESLEQQPPLQGILHLWSLESTLAVQELNKSQELGCGSVLHLVQALVKNQDIESPPLWLVTQGSQSVGDQSVIQFQQASLWGLGRVIAQEHEELQCRCLDLDSAVEDSQAVGALLQELLSPSNENQIAYRQEVRYVARLERQQKSLTSQQVSIGAEGSYLITGGLGALGLNTARWMVQQGAKHLVLTGRRQPSEEAQKIINELEESGAQILVLCGDISQKEDVSQILEKIQASLPVLKGVIHAAGVLDDGLLLNMNWEQFKKVMVPKVEGAWHLHNLTQEKPLDFFVCFSSMTS
ncbi:MAG: SDR family NAD(P)-dependent oxidoreductase, partial [Cyanobacteria bacterium P01_D01_bin.116]